MTPSSISSTSTVSWPSPSVVTNAARLGIELDLVQKQRLQQTLFPEGLRFDGEKFGTAATCLAFKKLDGSRDPNLARPELSAWYRTLSMDDQRQC